MTEREDRPRQGEVIMRASDQINGACSTLPSTTMVSPMAEAGPQRIQICFGDIIRLGDPCERQPGADTLKIGCPPNLTRDRSPVYIRGLAGDKRRILGCQKHRRCAISSGCAVRPSGIERAISISSISLLP